MNGVLVETNVTVSDKTNPQQVQKQREQGHRGKLGRAPAAATAADGQSTRATEGPPIETNHRTHGLT